MKVGIPQVALIGAAALFGVSVAAAQTGAPPANTPAFVNPPHKNLKVLPQDISGAQLLGTMKFFAQSLGVRCTYCHAGTEGQPLSTFDFASDAKGHKDTARGMLRLVKEINGDLPAITGQPDSKITCFTCHRGSTTPATMPPPTAAAAPGTPGASTKPERGAA
ncbi:MAG TPA: c-type cytochrome [Bradyrhizobium sp.]|nr:c-type cytochrome [Bradyrhizobium sp.]